MQAPFFLKMLKRYSLQFWLLCLSTLQFFFSFSVLIPELPDYITSLGGEDYKGATIGLFTIAAGLSRPLSGRLSDIIGRLPVMIFGGAVCVVLSVLYPMFTAVYGFLTLRFFHGLSTGFMPTGTVAYLSDIIPSERRGEALGLVGIMNNIGLMAGNAFSTLITDRIGMQGLFWLSGIVAFISVAIIFRMKETLPNPKPLKLNHFKLGLEDHWDKRAKDPAIVMLLSVTLFGTIITLIPDYSIGLGIENKGLFLSIATISTVFTRLTTSRLSDIKGRIFSCKIGTSFWFLASILLVFPSLTTFYIAAVLCGMASGINSPALFAWAVDVANGERSGRALATLFITLEAGITVGAFVSAYIYDNTFSNFRYVFLFLASIMVIALLFLVLGVNSKETKKSS